MAIASIEGLTEALDDRALFDAAVAPEPAPEEQTAEPSSPATEPTEHSPPTPRSDRQRDELGRFVSAGEQAAADEPPAGEAAPAPVGNEEFVPSWRLREEREAREAYAARLAERERQLTETLNYLRQQQAAAQPAPAPIDPVVDPAAFHRAQADSVAAIRNDFQTQLRTIQLENNLQLTRMQVGDELFDNAYRAFVEVGQNDQAFARAIVGAANPGATMVRWYTQASALNTVGPDPEAWFAQRKAELLQDPEFLQQAVEAARNYQPPARAPAGRPSTNMSQRPSSNVTVLPPSLMRMRGSTSSEATAASPGGDDPLSDNSLFAFATRTK